MKRFAWIGLLFAALLAASGVRAQGFPTEPIRIIVATTPGGLMDPFGRTAGDWLQKKWGQPVLLEHKPGAGGQLSGEYVAAAKPDGHTLWLTFNGPLIALPAFGKTRYQVERDFVPVALLARTPYAVVVPASLPVRSLKDLVALSKSTKDGLNYGTAGVGTGSHIASEMLRSLSGANMVHVPYKGATAAVSDLVAGRIQMMITNIPPVLPHIQAGMLRALAVTVPQRVELLPDVPTGAEAGFPDLLTTGFIAIMAPSATPKEIVQRLNAEINSAMESAEGRKVAAAAGGQIAPGSTDEFAAFLREDTRVWTKLIKENNIVAGD
ncbi:MAG: Bug family tripartite tricarboxylate transporter substrate binding protein [Reyranellaceae bacterium]